jgi:hypothetical protein
MRKVVMILAVFFIASGVLYAQEYEEGPGYEEGQAYLGVMLDMEPLPELITKHLGLEPEQGIRISNVSSDSPADKAGLERDDIIIVRDSEIGREVTLEVIHLGQRKTVTLTLGRLKGEVEWKYPTEPDFMQSWRPGRMFRRRPDREEWEELEMDIPEVRRGLQEQLREHYYFRHEEGEGEITVTIEGNPYDPDAMVVIRMGEEEKTVRIDEIGELPEEIRGIVKDDLEMARVNAHEREGRRRYRFEFEVPQRRPEEWPEFGPELGRFFEEHYRPQMESYREEMERRRFEPRPPRPPRPPRAPFGPGQEMFERIEDQMRDLQMRLEELEVQNRELLERMERDRGDEPAERGGYEHEEDYEGEHEENGDPDAVEGDSI